jgi:hypothetical protein
MGEYEQGTPLTSPLRIPLGSLPLGLSTRCGPTAPLDTPFPSSVARISGVNTRPSPFIAACQSVSHAFEPNGLEQLAQGVVVSVKKIVV